MNSIQIETNYYLNELKYYNMNGEQIERITTN